MRQLLGSCGGLRVGARRRRPVFRTVGASTRAHAHGLRVVARYLPHVTDAGAWPALDGAATGGVPGC
jgi:hypothetical protein